MHQKGRYSYLLLGTLALTVIGLTFSSQGQDQPNKEINPPLNQLPSPRFEPISENLVKLKIVFPGIEKPFRATELEGALIRVEAMGHAWGISPRINKDGATVSLELFEVTKSLQNHETREAFSRLEVLEVGQDVLKTALLAPFSVQLEKVIYKDGRTSPRSN